MTARASPNGHRPGPPHQTADWGAADYERDPRTSVLACCRRGCGAKYLDDDPGRVAHVAVFGHSPKPAEHRRGINRRRIVMTIAAARVEVLTAEGLR